MGSLQKVSVGFWVRTDSSKVYKTSCSACQEYFLAGLSLCKRDFTLEESGGIVASEGVGYRSLLQFREHLKL